MDTSLNNITLWLTRPKDQAENLTDLLEKRGAKVFHLPLMEIQPLPQDKASLKKIKKLEQYDMAFFISTNAASIAMELVGEYYTELPTGIGCFSPGPVTAKVLESYGLKVAYPKKSMRTEGMLILPELRKILQKESEKKKQALIFRGKGGRELLAKTLRSKDVDVEYIELYKRAIPEYKKKYLKEILQSEKPDGIVFSSAEAIHNFTFLFEKIYPEYYKFNVFVSSPRLVDVADKVGFETISLLKAADDKSIASGVEKINE
ncbi:MAG: uroporphyrinogen-III synthase [Gammaproteobacteria bacterium]|jgi:uroporphyrinogen-III synthase|nr:uroporphyrinogen-III synthase [Gammaproteobacteria bacterium]